MKWVHSKVPAWQRRGVGLYWEAYEKKGFNPVTQQQVTATRRRVKVDRDLPMKDEYAALIRMLLRQTNTAEAPT